MKSNRFKSSIVFAVLALSVLLSKASAAQTVTQPTTVTATAIIDSNSSVWTYATVNIQFVNNSSHPSTPPTDLNGNPIPTSYVGATDGSGNLSINVQDMQYAAPANSTLRFTICPNAINGCFSFQTVQATPTGSTFAIDTLVAANIAPPSFAPLTVPYGYSSADVLPPYAIGQLYQNTTTDLLNIYNGSTFAPLVNSAAGDPNITSDGNGNMTLKSITANGPNTSTFNAGVVATTAQLTGLTVSGCLVNDNTGVISSTACSGGTGTITGITTTSPLSGSGSTGSVALSLTTVPTSLGGLNTTTAPASGKIPIGQSSTAYAPEAVSGDATLASTGAVTVTGWQGNPIPSGTPTNNSVPLFTSGAWTFAAEPTGVVTSVFGRTGVVAATSGDYTVSQVTGAAPINNAAFTGTFALPSGWLLPAGNFPSLTGDTVSAGGTLATTVAGIQGIPVLSGYTPTNGQALIYSSSLTGYVPMTVESICNSFTTTGAVVVVTGVGSCGQNALAIFGTGVTSSAVATFTAANTALYVQSTNGSNTYPLVIAINDGSGDAGYFVNGNTTSGVAVVAEASGASGAALEVQQNGAGAGIQGNDGDWNQDSGSINGEVAIVEDGSGNGYGYNSLCIGSACTNTPVGYSFNSDNGTFYTDGNGNLTATSVTATTTGNAEAGVFTSNWNLTATVAISNGYSATAPALAVAGSTSLDSGAIETDGLGDITEINSIAFTAAVSTPTIAAGAGAGTSPTIEFASGTVPADNTMVVNLTTDLTPTGAGAAIFVVTLTSANANSFNGCIAYAGDVGSTASTGAANAASLALLAQPYAVYNNAGPTVTLYSNTTALTGSTPYSWVIHCF